MVSRSRFPQSVRPFLCVLALLALGASARADDLEEKLLRAELLEVSAGDLPKAVEAYKAIQADDKAPAELRARAQLNLGRCQRKLGELDGAKRSLEELIAAHPGEREVVRQAQAFLKELQGGKPENPQFDWLKELEKSPEIQARVFDLCMDLASDERASSARRQLRALGTVAVSGMERVLQVSRDDAQKQALALTLVQCGKYEWLQMLLDSESSLEWRKNTYLMEQFVMHIPTLPETSRQEIIEVADRITDPRLALQVSLLRLLAGDRRDLGAQLKAIEPFLFASGYQSVVNLGRSLLERLAKDAPVADFMAARILEDECPNNARNEYIAALRASAPAKLTPEHYARTVEKGRSMWLGNLANGENFAALERVAPIVGAEGIVDGLLDALRGLGDGWRRIPAGWARVLRAAHAFPELHWLAQVSDGALPEFSSFLRNRAAEAPEYVPTSFENMNHLRQVPPGAPSRAHIAAMALLLDSSDPVVLTIALESLAGATESLSLETLDVIERLAREASDDHVREFALNALVGDFTREPGTGPRAAAALFQEFTRRRAAKEAPASFTASPLVSVAGIWRTVRWPPPKATPGRVTRRIVPVPGRASASPPPFEPVSFADSLDWICRRLASMGGSTWAFAWAFYPHVLQLADSAVGERYYSWYVEVSGVDEFTPAFLESLAKVQSPELMVRFVDMLLKRFPPNQQGPNRPTRAFPPEIAGKLVAFFQRAALDDRVPIVSRLTACALAMDDAYAALDWPRLLEAGDPLAEGIITGLMPEDKDRVRRRVQDETLTFWRWFREQSAEFQRKFFAAGIASPDESIRAKVVSQHPLEGPEILAIFRKLLQDPSSRVRWAAVARLIQTSRADLGPLLVEMLSHSDSQLRNEAVKQLPRFASVESIEPLSKLLEDPDVGVQGAALEALKKIKAALEERKEWQDMVERLKSIPRPDKKTE